MNKAWLWVIIGGFCETTWAIFMKESNGFTEILWTVACVTFLFIAVFLLNSGLKRGIPVGSGYAVWVGVGGIGTFILGMMLEGDPVILWRFVFVAVILAGIIGVEMSSDIKQEEQPPQEEGRES